MSSVEVPNSSLSLPSGRASATTRLVPSPGRTTSFPAPGVIVSLPRAGGDRVVAVTAADGHRPAPEVGADEPRAVEAVVAVAELDPHRVLPGRAGDFVDAAFAAAHFVFRFLRRLEGAGGGVAWRTAPDAAGTDAQGRAVVGEVDGDRRFPRPGWRASRRPSRRSARQARATKWSTDWLTSPRTSSTLTVPAWAAAGATASAATAATLARIRLLSFMPATTGQDVEGCAASRRPCACGRARGPCRGGGPCG